MLHRLVRRSQGLCQHLPTKQAVFAPHFIQTPVQVFFNSLEVKNLKQSISPGGALFMFAQFSHIRIL